MYYWNGIDKVPAEKLKKTCKEKERKSPGKRIWLTSELLFGAG